MSSIRLRLLKWVIPPVLLMNLGAGALAYTLASPHLREAVLRTLILVEIVIALGCVGLIWFSVSNGLRPLSRLRADLNARDGDDLAPLAADDVPYELEPLVSSFNDLLAKVGEGAEARQDFLANVAHQLRTPLAGLKTQLEWLGARHAEPETAQSVRLMLSATERMIRQTNQLLALARAEPQHFEKARLEPLARPRASRSTSASTWRPPPSPATASCCAT